MPTPTPDITVYWRPGCPFCARLRRQLDRAGLPADWIDIWQDPRAAAGRMREVDRIMIDELHIDLVQMMENAGRNLADLAPRLHPTTAVVPAGAGGNGAIVELDETGQARPLPATSVLPKSSRASGGR